MRDDQWVVWCGTNYEQDMITAGLGDDCVSIYGRMTPEEKVALERRWLDGEVKTIITKPSIYGWGVNWQQCNQMIFVGLSDSYEAYYQSIRRCYRYGQTRIVNAHVVLSDLEGQIAANIRRKESESSRTTSELVAAIRHTHKELTPA